MSNARYYNLQAYTILDGLISSGLVEILNNTVYESVVWTRVTYNLDLPTLQNGWEWAKARGRLNAMAYTVFLLIVTLCNPEMKSANATAKTRTTVQEKQKSLLLPLHGQLSEAIEVSKYREVKDGRRTYAKLIDNSLDGMKAWINGDVTKAGQHVEAAAIQAALLTSPNIEAFIPTFFAAFVGMQLLGIDQAKYADVTELLVQSIARMHTFGWARVLTDFVISTLERFVGKVDVKWVGAAAATQSYAEANAAKRHLQLLASAGMGIFGPSGGPIGGHFNPSSTEGHFNAPISSDSTNTGIISM